MGIAVRLQSWFDANNDGKWVKINDFVDSGVDGEIKVVIVEEIQIKQLHGEVQLRHLGGMVQQM
jgi:hypothetical protein